MRLRARLFCLGFFAALSVAALSCALNPQPEPPAAEDDTSTNAGTGGSAGAPQGSANDAGLGALDPDKTADAATTPPPSRDEGPSADDNNGFDYSGQLPPAPGGGFENADDGGPHDRDAGRADDDPETPDAGAALSL